MRTADGYIVSRCLDGDSAAFGLLVDKYKGGVYALAYAKLRNFHDAEDVTQEAFVKAYQRLRSLKRYDNFHAWIYSITSNLCKDWIRARSRRPDTEFIEDQDLDALRDRSVDSYRENPMLDLVNEALDSLPEIYQQVLTLYYLGGMDSREIAEFLGMSSASVWQRLSRARMQLRQEMLAAMSTTFEEQKLQVDLTFRIVEAVKRTNIHPTPRAASLPWGFSFTTGIIIMVMALSPHLGILNPSSFPMGSPLSARAKVVEIGEIPVDVLEVSQIPSISSKQADADDGASSFAEQIMDSLGRIEGSVIGMDGKPVGNIKLTLDTIMDEYWINSSNYIQVDEGGRFVVDIPNYGRDDSETLERLRRSDIVEYRIMYYGRVEEDVRHANTPVITLRPGEERRGVVLDLRRDVHPLRIRVTDTQGDPIGNAGISVHVRFDDGSGHGLADARDEDNYTASIATNADGLTPFLYLSSCGYEFEVLADSFAPGRHINLRIPDEIPEGGIFDIRMRRGSRITGEVVDSDGNPVADACVAIRYYADDASGHRSGRGKNFDQKPTLDDAQTEEDGRFALTMLYPVGKYCIQVSHPDYGVDGKIDVPVGSEDVVFRLKPVVTLVGKVLKGSKPISDGRVYVNLLEAVGGYKVFEDNRIRPDRSSLICASLDASGAFRIPYLFPGCSYELEVRHGGLEYTERVRLTSQPENHITIHLD